MAYTGICMLEGEKIYEFYHYLADLYGRQVYSHELITLDIKKKAKEDFVRLCREEKPEIIRCKDCKNWDTTWRNDWAKNYHYCPLIDGTRNGDWYCADAERRTE